MSYVLCVFLRDRLAEGNMALVSSPLLPLSTAVVLSLEAATTLSAMAVELGTVRARGEVCLPSGCYRAAYAIVGEILVGVISDVRTAPTYAMATVHDMVTALTLTVCKYGPVTAAAAKKDLGRLVLLMEEAVFQGPDKAVGPQVLQTLFSRKLTEVPAAANTLFTSEATMSKGWLRREASAHVEHRNFEMLHNGSGFAFADDGFDLPESMDTMDGGVDFQIPNVTPLEPEVIYLPLATQLHESITVGHGPDPSFTVRGELLLQSRTVFVQRPDPHGGTARTITFHIDLSAPECAKSLDVSVHPACGTTMAQSSRSHVIKVTLYVALEGVEGPIEGPKYFTLLRYGVAFACPLPLPVFRLATSQTTSDLDTFSLRWAVNPEVAVTGLCFRVKAPADSVVPPFTAYDTVSGVGLWDAVSAHLPQTLTLRSVEPFGPAPSVAFDLEGRTQHPHSGVALSFMPSHLGSRSVVVFEGGHKNKVSYGKLQ